MTFREVDISLSDFIERFRDKQLAEAGCNQCPRFGTTWACPPFDFDVEERLHHYKYIRLIACSFHTDTSQNVSFETILPYRENLNEKLLEIESDLEGLACSFAGSCIICKECARINGHPCIHPDKVRPPLEAYGFNLVKTLEEIFDIKLEWANRGNIPKRLTLLGAVLYSSTKY